MSASGPCRADGCRAAWSRRLARERTDHRRITWVIRHGDASAGWAERGGRTREWQLWRYRPDLIPEEPADEMTRRMAEFRGRAFPTLTAHHDYLEVSDFVGRFASLADCRAELEMQLHPARANRRGAVETERTMRGRRR